MADQWQPLGTSRILWESLKLPSKNWALMLPILLLLTPLSSSLLYLSNYLSISPPLIDLLITLHVLLSAAPGTPQHQMLAAAARKDLVSLALIQAIFISVSFLLSSLLSIATINAAAATYLQRHLTLKELLTRVRRSWKGPMITQLYVAALALGCTLLLSAPVAFFAFVSDGSVPSITYAVVLALLGLYLYLRLAAVWWLGAVVSVVEDGCSGTAALARAAELIKGRRGQGMAITVLMMVVAGAVYGAYSVKTAFVPPTTASPLASGLAMVNVVGVWSAVILAAHTVFYYECKRSQGEEEMIRTRGGFQYTRVYTTVHVDEEVP